MLAHLNFPLKAVQASRPDNTGGLDWCVIDSKKRIIAEFFEHVGHRLEESDHPMLPATKYDKSCPRVLAEWMVDALNEKWKEWASDQYWESNTGFDGKVEL